MLDNLPGIRIEFPKTGNSPLGSHRAQRGVLGFSQSRFLASPPRRDFAGEILWLDEKPKAALQSNQIVLEWKKNHTARFDVRRVFEPIPVRFLDQVIALHAFDGDSHELDPLQGSPRLSPREPRPIGEGPEGGETCRLEVDLRETDIERRSTSVDIEPCFHRTSTTAWATSSSSPERIPARSSFPRGFECAAQRT